MGYYFKPFPFVQYDLKKDNKPVYLTDITLRFKLHDLIRNKIAIYYDYQIKDHERADIIANKYYGDSRLDWVIWLTNLILNPRWDWPLSYQDFVEYIKQKYGSVGTAQTTVHHYEQILNNQSVLYDGTIIPKRTLIVDSNTYNTLAVSERQIVYCYDYEDNLNEQKRNIQLLDKKYITQLVNEAENIFR